MKSPSYSRNFIIKHNPYKYWFHISKIILVYRIPLLLRKSYSAVLWELEKMRLIINKIFPLSSNDASC